MANRIICHSVSSNAMIGPTLYLPKSLMSDRLSLGEKPVQSSD